MQFVALEKLINLHDGYRREFRLDYHRLLLVQHQGERHVIEALCPHQEHPLTDARLDQGELTCPLHGYRFSLLNGAVLHASREPCRPLRVWSVAYEGAEIGILWEEA